MNPLYLAVIFNDLVSCNFTSIHAASKNRDRPTVLAGKSLPEPCFRKSTNESHDLHILIMPPRRHSTRAERSQIIGARLNGGTLKVISNLMNINYETVKYTWRQYGNRDNEERDLPRSGRPRKTTQDQDNRLYRRLRIDNDLQWKKLLEVSDLGRTQIQQRMLEIDPSFHQYVRHWSPVGETAYRGPVGMMRKARWMLRRKVQSTLGSYYVYILAS